MKNITSVITLLLFISYTSISSAEVNNQQKKSVVKNNSIAKPNWWKKPSGTSAKLMNKGSNQSSRMSASQISTMRTEPLAHFLDFLPDNNWQLMSNNVGMASAKYQITLSGNQYELAIIRMNKQIPLESVLNIWQNKVGLVAQPKYQQIPLKTKKEQNINLITIKGDQKAILVAFHKQEKYTFFRLFAEHGLNKEISANFKKFLNNVYIKN